MTNKNKFNDALGVIGAWVAANPALMPSQIEYTVQCILRYLKKVKLEVTVENMNTAFDRLKEAVDAMSAPEPEATPRKQQEKAAQRLQKRGDNDPVTLEEVKTWSPEQIAQAVAMIDGWSSSHMSEVYKDSNMAEVCEWLLSQKPVKKEVSQPKPQPKPQQKPPVKKNPLDVAIDKMTSEQFKKALLDPVKAKGIENTLRDAQRNQ